MSLHKVKSKPWERLLSVIRRNRVIYKIARNAYIYLQDRKDRFNREFQREFNMRIAQINPDDYLNISHKPNLNIIIIVIDSLRNSHLSCQGYYRETTPFLDSFGSRFTAISAAPWTYPSVASILTGLYPHNHNAISTGEIKSLVKIKHFQKIRKDILTLPEMLFLLGYKIYFVISIAVAFYPLRGRVIPVRFKYHFSARTRADKLLDGLIKWIDKQKRERFFAYVHLGDLHIPLNPPDNFKNFFGDVKNLPHINGWSFFHPETRKNNSDGFQEYKENRQLLYDNTVRYVDYAIERFYKRLEAMGLLDSSIVIVTADHGDQFWEHAELEAKYFYNKNEISGISHGSNVFNELIQVPLLISGPVTNKKPGYSVSTVDIVPTIIDLLGVNHSMRFDGRNIFNETDKERPLLSESTASGYEKKALVIGRYKLIYSKGDGVQWLFDLDRDPNEQHPIMDQEITSIYGKKLLNLIKEDQKGKIRDIVRKKGL